MTNEPHDPNDTTDPVDPPPFAPSPADPEAADSEPDSEPAPDPEAADSEPDAEPAPDPEAADSEAADAEPAPDFGPPPPGPGVPPSFAAPPADAGVRRLVRDPFTRLGGVASGIAHHYGFDVSLVRLAFVLGIFASGIGLVVYLLAWLIVPRAEHWPPAGPARPASSMSRRDLGVGVAVLGVIVALALGVGDGSFDILIPVVLVAGGVWLLLQPSVEPGPSTVAAAATATGTGPPPTATSGPEWTGPASLPAGFQPAGAPVPPRSRMRRARRILGFAFLGLLALIAIPILLIAAIAIGLIEGNIEFDPSDREVSFRPATVAAIPAEIDEGAADVTLDLTRLDAADFADLDEPIQIDAQVDFGEITVIVPDDIEVSVDAETDLGEVTVFGRSEGTLNASIVDEAADPDIELNLDVDLGQIRVER